MDQYGLIDALARDDKLNHSRRKIKKSVTVICDEIAEALAVGSVSNSSGSAGSAQ